MKRPSRAEIERLRARNGELVGVRQIELVEDVDGWPLGVDVTDHGTATLAIPTDPRLLGWTPAEWADPNITE